MLHAATVEGKDRYIRLKIQMLLVPQGNIPWPDARGGSQGLFYLTETATYQTLIYHYCNIIMTSTGASQF